MGNAAKALRGVRKISQEAFNNAMNKALSHLENPKELERFVQEIEKLKDLGDRAVRDAFKDNESVLATTYKKLVEALTEALGKPPRTYKPSGRLKKSLEDLIFQNGRTAAAKIRYELRAARALAAEIARALGDLTAGEKKGLNAIIDAGLKGKKSSEDILADLVKEFRKWAPRGTDEQLEALAKAYMESTANGKEALKQAAERGAKLAGGAAKVLAGIAEVAEKEMRKILGTARLKKYAQDITETFLKGEGGREGRKKLRQDFYDKIVGALKKRDAAGPIKKKIKEALEAAGKTGDDISDDAVEKIYKETAEKLAKKLVGGDKKWGVLGNWLKRRPAWCVKTGNKAKCVTAIVAALLGGTGVIEWGGDEEGGLEGPGGGGGGPQGLGLPGQPPTEQLKKDHDTQVKKCEGGDKDACAEAERLKQVLKDRKEGQEAPPHTSSGGISTPGTKEKAKAKQADPKKQVAGGVVPDKPEQVWPQPNEWVGWSSMKVIRRLKELGIDYDKNRWWRKLPRMHPARVAMRTFWKAGAGARRRKRKATKYYPTGKAKGVLASELTPHEREIVRLHTGKAIPVGQSAARKDFKDILDAAKRG